MFRVISLAHGDRHRTWPFFGLYRWHTAIGIAHGLFFFPRHNRKPRRHQSYTNHELPAIAFLTDESYRLGCNTIASRIEENYRLGLNTNWSVHTLHIISMDVHTLDENKKRQLDRAYPTQNLNGRVIASQTLFAFHCNSMVKQPADENLVCCTLFHDPCHRHTVCLEISPSPDGQLRSCICSFQSVV